MEEIEITTEKSFKIELETDKNNTYSITINLNNNWIDISGEQINNIFHKTFFGKFSSDEINEFEYFIQFGSLSEIFDEIKLRLSNNRIILKEDNNILQIKVPLPSQKSKEIVLNSRILQKITMKQLMK